MGQAFRASPRTIPRVCLLGAGYSYLQKTGKKGGGGSGIGGRDQTLRKLLQLGNSMVPTICIWRSLLGDILCTYGMYHLPQMQVGSYDVDAARYSCYSTSSVDQVLLQTR